jgi:hypothetical protein
MNKNDVGNIMKETNQKRDEFNDMIESIENTSDKKKFLWKEIYNNALSDRSSAEILFYELIALMDKTVTAHESYGNILVKYLDKMNKSNEQLLSLAKLIAESETNHEVSEDDIFSRIAQ